MTYLTNENITALEAKIATMKPEINREHNAPTSRTFTDTNSKITLSLISTGIMIDNGVAELGTIHHSNTAIYKRLKNLINNGKNADDFDDALNASQYGEWLPKIIFKMRMGSTAWGAIETWAQGVGVVGDDDFAAPNQNAKFWLEVYADAGLENVFLADPETLSLLDTLLGADIITAERKAAILAV